MISFASDYVEGCHPRILQVLEETNLEQTEGYGTDPYCQEAREQIREVFACPQADVHFLVGGTQTNLLAVTAALRPHEGVIAVLSGHINVHETGAIEAAGHKVLALQGENGKLSAGQVEAALRAHRDEPTREHMVKPGMIYLSNTTELGTLYGKEELRRLYQLAREWQLPLYIDGARLGSALTARGQDLRPEDLPELCDAFSIGGTKNGLLFGEALVILNESLKKDFRYIQKQRGAMLAKGRLLGLQFRELFRDRLFFELAEHENEMARILAEGLSGLGVRFAAEAVSNQIFILLPNATLSQLEKDFVFEVQAAGEKESEIRLCTSWATREESVRAFLEALAPLSVAARK